MAGHFSLLFFPRTSPYSSGPTAVVWGRGPPGSAEQKREGTLQHDVPPAAGRGGGRAGQGVRRGGEGGSVENESAMMPAPTPPRWECIKRVEIRSQRVNRHHPPPMCIQRDHNGRALPTAERKDLGPLFSILFPIDL